MIINSLIVGLGNHEPQYLRNRHNIGFLVIDSICKNLNLVGFQENRSNDCLISTMKLGDKKFFFVKPTTYMNSSGIAIQKLKNFYKIDNQRIMVFYDDIDLKSGKCKIICGGGHNGQNGIKSVDSLCGKDYFKFKIGIGRDSNKNIPLSDFVLSDLSKEEILRSESIGKIVAEHFEKLFDHDGHSVIMNHLSRLSLPREIHDSVVSGSTFSNI